MPDNLETNTTSTTKYHVSYKPLSVVIMYSKNNINKVSPSDYILDPLFTGTETIYHSNTKIFFGHIFGIPMKQKVYHSFFSGN